MPALEVMRARREKTDMIIADYTVDVVEGVLEHQEQIDEFLSTYSQGWTLDRMPAVDLMILRIGSWELLYNDEVMLRVVDNRWLHDQYLSHFDDAYARGHQSRSRILPVMKPCRR